MYYRLWFLPITAAANFINEHSSFSTRGMSHTFFHNITERKSTD